MQWKSTVYHSPAGVYLEGRATAEATVTLHLRVSHDAPVRAVYLRYAPDGEEQTLEAVPTGEREGYACKWWSTTVRLGKRDFHYRFLLRTDNGIWWYGNGGLSRHIPTYHTDFRILLDDHSTEWLDDTVFYQIFPDRFCMKHPENRIRDGEHLLDGKPVVAREWGALPDERQGAREFYGGDLGGITDCLPYLQEKLGVNALYLNPIFTAPSSHRYDVASYREVDPHLGGDGALETLREATRERNMRIILDIVPNHCGVQHPWFQEARRDAHGDTAEFFTFHQHPDRYESWLGIDSLPKLNYRSDRLKEIMYRGEDSIFKYWMRPPFEVDGWRIDVANMLGRGGADHLGHKILRGIRRAVKEVNPQAYLLGENFFDASSYLQGDQLDAGMNYRGFMMPLYHWLTGRDYHHLLGRPWGDDYPLDSEDLGAHWSSFQATLPWSVTRRQFNLLDSHDTPRLLHMTGGDRRQAAIARFLLFAFPGVPSVYYGDEVGLEGGRDPDNRRCMNWNRRTWDQEWFLGWADLIDRRKSLPALRGGTYQPLLFKKDTVCFLREAPSARLVAVAKRRADDVDKVPVDIAAIPDGTVFVNLEDRTDSVVSEGFLPLSRGATQMWVER